MRIKKWLLSYIKKQKINIKEVSWEKDMPSTSVPEHDYIILNLKFKPEIQNFTLGHEIGHVSWFRAADNKTEDSANTFSLHLIYRFSLNKGEEKLTADNFEKLYSIPLTMKGELIQLLKGSPKSE